MLKSKSFGTTAADYARHLRRSSGKLYVLVVKKDIYRLDNQKEAEKWGDKQ